MSIELTGKIDFNVNFGGEGGIRTHAGLHPNGFQDRPVMTASVPLHIGWGSRTRTYEMPESKSGALPTWLRPTVNWCS